MMKCEQLSVMLLYDARNKLCRPPDENVVSGAHFTGGNDWPSSWLSRYVSLNHCLRSRKQNTLLFNLIVRLYLSSDPKCEARQHARRKCALVNSK